jgi:hypothetical protein
MKTYRDIAHHSVILGETSPPIVTQDETIFQGIPVSWGMIEWLDR